LLFILPGKTLADQKTAAAAPARCITTRLPRFLDLPPSLIPMLASCNILTNFEYEMHAMNKNGNYGNLLKLALKNYFWRFFCLLEPLCSGEQS
jgi:hypothetical protein